MEQLAAFFLIKWIKVYLNALESTFKCSLEQTQGKYLFKFIK